MGSRPMGINLEYHAATGSSMEAGRSGEGKGRGEGAKRSSGQGEVVCFQEGVGSRGFGVSRRRVVR